MATTAEPPTVAIDVLAEATRIVGESVRSAVRRSADSSEVCGCRGCEAQAVQAADWAARIFAVDL